MNPVLQATGTIELLDIVRYNCVPHTSCGVSRLLRKEEIRGEITSREVSLRNLLGSFRNRDILTRTREVRLFKNNT